VPAAALTAYAREEGNGRLALEAGFRRHLVKPVDPLDLAWGRRRAGGVGCPCSPRITCPGAAGAHPRSAGVAIAAGSRPREPSEGSEAAWNYTLNEPSQGRVAALLFVGGTLYCADAPAKATGEPPSTASNDRVDKFVAQPNTPAPPFCIAP
jgi:CheY-like chemotaxis protein